MQRSPISRLEPCPVNRCPIVGGLPEHLDFAEGIAKRIVRKEPTREFEARAPRHFYGCSANHRP